MTKRILSLLGLAALLSTTALGIDWKVQADYAETCSCNVICPCLFGGDPSHRECLGQGYLRIRKGHYGNVDLAGVEVHSTFKMGEWERYTVSDQATPEQAEAVHQVIKAAFSLPGSEIVSFKQGPVSYRVEGDHIRFGTDGSKVDLEAVNGADGTPMRLENHPMFPHYKVYRSVNVEHESETREFSLSGTNGFTCVRSASSEDAKS